MPKENILKIFVIAGFILHSSLFVSSYGSSSGSAEKDEVLHSKLNPRTIATSDKEKRIYIESIELKRRNWESRGTDTLINSNGTFVVKAVFLGKSKIVHNGTLSQSQLQDLTSFVDKVHIFALDDEYSGPLKTSWSWWGYILTVKTNQGTKTVRFHSEDNTVPDSLNSLVRKILETTKK